MARVLFIIKPFCIDPLGIAYLSTGLKKDGHEVSLLRTDDQYFEKNIEYIQPNFICYSVTTGNHKFYLTLNQALKKELPFHFISVFGGPHCTYFPDIIKEPGVDFICLGEGESAIRELIGSERTSICNVKIKNIYSKYRRNELAEALSSESYMPDRELIYSYKENLLNPIKNAMTMRGCAFNCPYCYNFRYHELFGKKVIFYNIDNVIKDLMELRDKWGAKFIWFEDDMFICKPSRLRELLIRYKNEVGLPYHCQVRAELVTDDIVDILKRSGCVSVTFAIESGNDNIRMNLLERDMTKEQILNCCKMLKKRGILYRTENMVGLPGETLKQAFETLDFNIKAKSDLPWCSVYQPYPLTKLGNIAADADPDTFGSDFFTTSPMQTKDRKQFDRLQKLFSLAAHYKVIRLALPLLLHIPLDKMYNSVSLWYKHKIYDTKLYVYK